MASKLKQIPERLLAKLWKERATREESFRADDGRRFRVIYPGRIGTTAGPDFRDAVVEEEGVGLVRGDVEVHVRQRDWDAHGHGKDPRYNGVVLHVVARMSQAYTTLHSGRRVPVVSLEPLLHAEQPREGNGDLWSLLKVHGYWPPQDAAESGRLLDRAGDDRFLKNSGAFLDLLQREEPDQVLYAALMEALGYSQNVGPFMELAYKLPYSLLRRKVVACLPEDRLRTIQGLLLEAAGFLPHPQDPRAVGRYHWRTFRVRPQNHPERRIGGFAHVLELFLPSSEAPAPEARATARNHPLPVGPGNLPSPTSSGGGPRTRGDGERTTIADPEVSPPSWTKAGLLEGFTSLVRMKSGDAGGRHCRSLESALMGICQPIPGSAVTDNGQASRAPIGKGRARDMAVNCALPFLHALALLSGDAALERRALEIYRGFPKLQENELTREMRQQLFSHPKSSCAGHSGPGRDGNGHLERIVCNARRQQGLLHLHRLTTSPARVA